MDDVATSAGPVTSPTGGVRRLATGVLVLAALVGLWEGYKWLWQTAGWTWPFAVDDVTMPHLYKVVEAFWQPTTTRGPPLIPALLNAEWVTGKAALSGLLLGSLNRFLNARVPATSR